MKNEIIVTEQPPTTEVVVEEEVLEAEIIDEEEPVKVNLISRLTKLGYTEFIFAIPVLPEHVNLMYGVCDSLGLHKPRDYYVEKTMAQVRTFHGFRVVNDIFVFNKLDLNIVRTMIRERFLTCIFELRSESETIKLFDTREVYELLNKFDQGG